MANFTNPSFETNTVGWSAGRSPLDISTNLNRWIDASQETIYANSDPVTVVKDFSGNGYDINQTFTGREPTFSSSFLPNGRPSYVFNGSNNMIYETTSPSINTGSWTVHLAFNAITAAGGVLYGFGFTGNATSAIVSDYIGSLYVNRAGNPSGVADGVLPLTTMDNGFVEHTITSEAIRISNHGKVITTGSQFFTSGLGAAIGDYWKANPAQQPLFGYLAEAIVYDRLLTDAENHDITSYLSMKYGIALETASGSYGSKCIRDTGTVYTGSGSLNVAALANTNVFETFNPTTGNKVLSCYAYNGGTVTSADVELFYDGSAVSTTYSAIGGGWYKLEAVITGANANKKIGAQVKAGANVFLDVFDLTAQNRLFFGVKG
jgi:hypothetical protein